MGLCSAITTQKGGAKILDSVSFSVQQAWLRQGHQTSRAPRSRMVFSSVFSFSLVRTTVRVARKLSSQGFSEALHRLQKAVVDCVLIHHVLAYQ